MTPEDILAWRMTCSRFSIRCMIERQRCEGEITTIGKALITFASSLLFANNADFFLTHHSASQDVSDYERMRRLSGCRSLASGVKLRVIR